MIAAILCPGPSLARLTGPPQADVLLAVNTAMDSPAAEGAQWWCCHDLWTPPRKLPQRQPLACCTSPAAIAEGQAKYVPWPL